MANEIVELDIVKAYLNITDPSTDGEIQSAIDTASLVVESYVGAVVNQTVSETRDGPNGHALVLHHGPVQSIASVSESGAALSSGDYRLADSGVLHRMGGGYSYRSWQGGAQNITVSYVVGRAFVPANLATGVCELVRINFRPQLGGNYSPFDGGDSDDYAASGDQIRLGFFVPGRVIELIAPNLVILGFA